MLQERGDAGIERPAGELDQLLGAQDDVAEGGGHGVGFVGAGQGVDGIDLAGGIVVGQFGFAFGEHVGGDLSHPDPGDVGVGDGGKEGGGGTFDGVWHGAASSRQGDEIGVGGGIVGGVGQLGTHKVNGTDDAGGSGFPVGGVGWHKDIWRWKIRFDLTAYLCTLSFDLLCADLRRKRGRGDAQVK